MLSLHRLQTTEMPILVNGESGRAVLRRAPAPFTRGMYVTSFPTGSGIPIEQVNYLAGHKSMAMTIRYDHTNEERYGGAIEALDQAGKSGIVPRKTCL